MNDSQPPKLFIVYPNYLRVSYYTLLTDPCISRSSSGPPWACLYYTLLTDPCISRSSSGPPWASPSASPRSSPHNGDIAAARTLHRLCLGGVLCFVFRFCVNLFLFRFGIIFVCNCFCLFHCHSHEFAWSHQLHIIKYLQWFINTMRYYSLVLEIFEVSILASPVMAMTSSEDSESNQ
jgi:hypothetical protein